MQRVSKDQRPTHAGRSSVAVVLMTVLGLGLIVPAQAAAPPRPSSGVWAVKTTESTGSFYVSAKRTHVSRLILTPISNDPNCSLEPVTVTSRLLLRIIRDSYGSDWAFALKPSVSSYTNPRTVQVRRGDEVAEGKLVLVLKQTRAKGWLSSTLPNSCTITIRAKPRR